MEVDREVARAVAEHAQVREASMQHTGLIIRSNPAAEGPKRGIGHHRKSEKQATIDTDLTSTDAWPTTLQKRLTKATNKIKAPTRHRKAGILQNMTATFYST